MDSPAPCSGSAGPSSPQPLGLPAQILAGHTPRIDYVRNEETEEHPEIFAFRGLKQSWPDFWRNFHYYG